MRDFKKFGIKMFSLVTEKRRAYAEIAEDYELVELPPGFLEKE
jgi:hypothetical protein